MSHARGAGTHFECLQLSRPCPQSGLSPATAHDLVASDQAAEDTRSATFQTPILSCEAQFSPKRYRPPSSPHGFTNFIPSVLEHLSKISNLLAGPAGLHNLRPSMAAFP